MPPAPDIEGRGARQPADVRDALRGLGSMTAKDAKLVLKLTADSGYEATAEYRVSAYQWGDIVALCEESERGRKLAVGAELYEALKGVTRTLEAFSHTNHFGPSQRKRLEAAREAIAQAESSHG